MPIIKSASAPTFSLEGLSVTGLAAPSRGAAETCVWRLSLAAQTPGTEHSVDREEIFVVLSGHATAIVGGEPTALAPGDALIVPAHTTFSLANPHDAPFEAIAVLPVGGLARMPGAAAFCPPWAS